MSTPQLTVEQIGARMKAQFPGAYDDVEDSDLGKALLTKYGPLATPTFQTRNELDEAGNPVVAPAPVSPWTKAQTIGPTLDDRMRQEAAQKLADAKGFFIDTPVEGAKRVVKGMATMGRLFPQDDDFLQRGGLPPVGPTPSRREVAQGYADIAGGAQQVLTPLLPVVAAKQGILKTGAWVLANTAVGAAVRNAGKQLGIPDEYLNAAAETLGLGAAYAEGKLADSPATRELVLNEAKRLVVERAGSVPGPGASAPSGLVTPQGLPIEQAGATSGLVTPQGTPVESQALMRRPEQRALAQRGPAIPASALVNFPFFSRVWEAIGGQITPSGLVTSQGTPLERAATIYLPGEGLEGHLKVAPAAAGRNGWTLFSSRVPDAVDVVENAPQLRARQPLVTDLSMFYNMLPGGKRVLNPLGYDSLGTIAERIKPYEMLPTAQSKGKRQDVVNNFVQRLKDNYLWLWDHVPEEVRNYSRLWYEGAHDRAHENAKTWDVDPEQAAINIAAMSPQKDWFENAEVAERFGNTWRLFTDKNVKFTGDLFDQYVDTARARLERSKAYTKAGPEARAGFMKDLEQKLKEERQRFVGQSFMDLPELMQARMIAAYAEGAYPKEYHMLLPTGTRGGLVLNVDGSPAKLPWGVPDENLVKSLRALKDPTPENLSAALGWAHKVRSFGNNIIDPWDPRFVTIDTHSYAAGHLLPFSQSAQEVNFGMGGVTNKFLGLKGANPIYAEAHNLAAQERNVLPREMQSVTWEAIRGLFPDTLKNDKFLAKYRAIWDNYKRGAIPLGKVYDEILANSPTPGRIPHPDWAPTLLGPGYQ